MTGWASEPGWARLIPTCRRSLERTGGSLDTSVTLTNPTDDERRLIIGITGVHRSVAAGRLTVRLRDIDSFLVSAYGRALPELLAEIDGRPLRDRPSERAREETQRLALLSAAASSVHTGQPWFADWIEDLRALATRLVRSDVDIARVVRVLDALPAFDEPLPIFAQRVLGDTKALAEPALCGLVLRALARRAGVEPPAGAEEERALWEAAGIVPDDLASQVLVLNVPARGGLVATWLNSATSAGVPLRLTLHQLRLDPFEVAAGEIFVTENPAVLRAATALGPAASAIVCTEGIASVAVHQLLGRAPQATLCWRNDFDWAGVRMTAAALARYPNARPWRMSASDYADHASHGTALRGVPTATPWDPDLADAMVRFDRAVMEESLIGTLLDDLRR